MRDRAKWGLSRLAAVVVAGKFVWRTTAVYDVNLGTAAREGRKWERVVVIRLRVWTPQHARAKEHT